MNNNNDSIPNTNFQTLNSRPLFLLIYAEMQSFTSPNVRLKIEVELFPILRGLKSHKPFDGASAASYFMHSKMLESSIAFRKNAAV